MELEAVPDDVGAHADARVVPEHLLQLRLALLERLSQERCPIEPQQVEDDVLEVAGPRAEEREVRLAVIAERDDLPVHDRLGRGDPGRWLEEAPEVARGILLAARPGPHLPIAHDGLHPEAIPLHLEQPVGVVEGRCGEGREHRIDEVRHVLLRHGGSVAPTAQKAPARPGRNASLAIATSSATGRSRMGGRQRHHRAHLPGLGGHPGPRDTAPATRCHPKPSPSLLGSIPPPPAPSPRKPPTEAT